MAYNSINTAKSVQIVLFVIYFGEQNVVLGLVKIYR